jgi:proton-translocating NADH-quinone oxidoreductase chain N
MNSTILFWLITLPLALAPLVYLTGRLRLVTANGPADTQSQTPPVYWMGLAVLGITWVPMVLAIQEFLTNGPLGYTYGSITLQLDGLSLLLAVLALGLGTLALLYSGPYLAGETGTEKYYALLIMMVGTMIGLTCSGDLFNMWVWLEALSVTAYLLVAFYRDIPTSLEAGVKYLTQSAAGSVLILFGIALVLAQTGTLNLAQLSTTAGIAPILLAAAALFVIGFGVKIAMVPMHTWLPDAHSQAPSSISAMLSGVVIEAGLIALLRIITALAGIELSWGILLMGFGTLNIVAGNLLALRQTQIKRMLAFSSLSHVGYMLLGLGIGLYAGEAAGVQGGLFHLLTHGLMKGLAFLAAGVLLHSLHTARGSHQPLTITDLAGASKRYPLTALTLSIALLALGGLPPLAGFMSKWMIMVAGFNTQQVWINLLIIFAALNSVLSLAYYAPVVNALYREKPSDVVEKGQPVAWAMHLPLVVLAVLVVVLGIWPGLIMWLIDPAAAAVMAALGG